MPVTALVAHAMRAEVRLIHFDITVLEGRLTRTFSSDAPTDVAEDRHRSPVWQPGS